MRRARTQSAKTKSAKSVHGKKPTRLKKAFDLSRDSIYVADPISDLRICGAKGVVPADEAGDLDTPPGPAIPVRDARRLQKPLAGIKASVDLRGVKRPIIIGKIDDVATVLDGKSTVRAARASNRRRAQDGRPPIRVRCVMQRDVSPLAVLSTMITTNNNRTEDTLADKVDKLVAYLGDPSTPSEADAAIEFGVTVDRIRDWVDFADQAIGDVKEAVDAGTISASTALEIAKIKEVDGQKAALAKILGAPDARDRSARAARAIAQGANGTPTITDRRSQRLLLSYLQAPAPARRSSTPSEEGFWQGVVEALKAVTGQAADPRVIRAIAEARTQPSPTAEKKTTPRTKFPPPRRLAEDADPSETEADLSHSDGPGGDL